MIGEVAPLLERSSSSFPKVLPPAVAAADSPGVACAAADDWLEAFVLSQLTSIGGWDGLVSCDVPSLVIEMWAVSTPRHQHAVLTNYHLSAFYGWNILVASTSIEKHLKVSYIADSEKRSNVSMSFTWTTFCWRRRGRWWFVTCDGS